MVSKSFLPYWFSWTDCRYIFGMVWKFADTGPLSHGARLAGIDCIDAAHSYYRDVDGTRRAAEWAAQLGFSGKTCLSPVQVAPINEAFAPTDEEVAWAHSVLSALDEAASNDSAVAVSDGMMVDAPHADLARQILERIDGLRVEPAS